MAQTVKLTPMEMMLAAQVGVIRQLQALRSRSPEKAGAKPEDDWGSHVEGAAGELAVAKSLNAAWTGCSRRAAADLLGWSVRTRTKHEWDLIVRDCDPDDDKYVLVTGNNGEYVIRGWIRGRDAKDPRFRQAYGNRPSAFFVPASELHPWEGKQS